MNTNPSNSSVKKNNMTLMLLPWMVLWIAVPAWGNIGSAICMAVCVLLFFAKAKWKFTVFEPISSSSCFVISLLTILGTASSILMPVSYLLFGLMWLVTAFMRIPLTAYYSLNNYGGEEMLKNDIFIKTNRILTVCWSVLYLLMAVSSYLPTILNINLPMGIINLIVPALLGMFTAWFQKWYPARCEAKN